MKKQLSICVVLCCCACGDLGSSQVDVSQDQNSIQAVNQEELNCNIQCTINADDEVSAIKTCEGSGPLVVAVSTFDQCDSIDEITNEEAVEVE